MKNSEIHTGLSESATRDFLASFLGAKSGYYPGVVEALERRIRSLQDKLIKVKQAEAALDLCSQRGWEDFDISDYISDYTKVDYFPFIGTKEELEMRGIIPIPKE